MQDNVQNILFTRAAAKEIISKCAEQIFFCFTDKIK